MALYKGIKLERDASEMIQPSNNSADLTDPSTSPRFYVNATGSVHFPSFVVAPLGPYAYISRDEFKGLSISGVLVNTDASNANQPNPRDFNYVSCDPEDYEGGNLDADGILSIITNSQATAKNPSSLIFYSTRSNHCNASDISALPSINGVFTTLDPVVAAQVAQLNLNEKSYATALLSPDPYAYTAGSYVSQPTSAVAMIILYSISGVITALFVIIIITGAVRAHRNPDRYGPRNTPGQTRQSRAKGIARAMLETLPIVKFGDHHDLPKDKGVSESNIELGNRQSAEATEINGGEDKVAAETTITAVGNEPEPIKPHPKPDTEAIQNADGSDEAGALGCSICTEDFKKGEEVRVLPCNHKFHPDCVDPWLLNVSGTCPLCRISLAPGEDSGDATIPPPLSSNTPSGDRRSQAIHHLMAIAHGSRDERVSALRQYRNDRHNRNPNQGEPSEEERISRARRFREALRVRTRRYEPNETATEMRNSGIDAISGPQMRF